MLKLVAWSLLLAALAAFGARPAYVIDGQVRDERGAPARGVRVCAYHEGFDPNRPHVVIPCGWSDAGGQFAISAPQPGKYTLFYDHSLGGHFSPYRAFFRHPSFPAPEVLVDDGNASASVTVSMPPRTGSLAGRGVDAGTGLPVDNLQFILCHADAPGVCRATSAKHNQGNFKIAAPYVPFSVRVRAEGYDDWFGPDGGERGSVLSVEAGTTQRLDVRLRRSDASAGRALHESEKRAGAHLPAPSQLGPADETVFGHYPRRTRSRASAARSRGSR